MWPSTLLFSVNSLALPLRAAAPAIIFRLMRALLLLLAACAAATAAVDIAFDTGSPARIVTPESNAPALVLTNTGDAPETVTCTWSLEGAPAQSRRATLPAKGSLRLPVPVSGAFGIKRIEYSLAGGSPRAARFAYLRPVGATPLDRSASGFLFGIAYGAGPDNRNPDAVFAMAQCGVKVARVHPNWGATQRSPGAPYDWSAFDEMVSLHERAGIEPQVLLSGTPRWAVRKGIDPANAGSSAPPDPGLWRVWVRAVAQRYAGRVRFWEIWNEPDIFFFTGTTEEYLELLRIASEEIRAAVPRAVVMTGGFATLSHRDTKTGMLEAVLARHPWYDAIAYHRHGFFPDFRREIDLQLLPLRAAAGASAKPLYFTETAMDTRVSELHQAETLVKKFVFTWSRGAIGHTWFNWRDKGGPRQAGESYGLYTREGEPKLAYAAYNNLVAQLGGGRFLRTLDLGEGNFGYLFQQRGEYVLVAWHEDPTKLPALAPVRTSASRVARIDLTGNRTGEPAQGALLVQTAATPSYWRFGGGEPEILGRLISGKGTRFELSNPLPTPLEFTIQGRRTVVPAGGRAPLALSLPPAPPQRRFGEISATPLPYSAGRWKGVLPIPATPAVVLTAGQPLHIRLEREEQYTFLKDHDPHSSAERWTGRADLSARAVVVYSAAARQLHVEVPVTDDVAAPGDAVEVRLGALSIPCAPAGTADRTCRVAISEKDAGDLAKGVRFNIVVHDDDGRGVAGWLAAAAVPAANPDPEMFPLLIVEEPF